MTNWKDERCAQHPEKVEIISSSKLIQRKDIKEVHHPIKDGQPEYTEFTCKSRTMTAAEYAAQVAEDNIATQAYVDMMLEDM